MMRGENRRVTVAALAVAVVLAVAVAASVILGGGDAAEDIEGSYAEGMDLSCAAAWNTWIDNGGMDDEIREKLLSIDLSRGSDGLVPGVRVLASPDSSEPALCLVDVSDETATRSVVVAVQNALTGHNDGNYGRALAEQYESSTAADLWNAKADPDTWEIYVRHPNSEEGAYIAPRHGSN